MFIENEKFRNIFIGIMLFGLFVFIVGLALSFKVIYWDVRGKESTKATIISINNNSTTCEYIVNGKKYAKKYFVNSSTYYVGKKIKIYYNPIRPQKSSIALMRYLILIVPFIGILILGVSGIGLIIYYMKYIRPKM